MIRHTANEIDNIALGHGQVRYVLRHVLQLSEEGDAALDATLKLLRRNGIPFARHEMPGGPGINVVYRFEHIMELAVALFLHRQAILKQDTITLLEQLRDELTPLYRRAWLERDHGLGSRVSIKVGDEKTFKASGIWLDLGLRYFPGQVLTTTGPKALGPAGAVRELIRVNRQRYFRDPIKISDLAAEVVELSKNAPEVRRGRR